MPEPFKNLINHELIEGLSLHFHHHWSEFDSQSFVMTATEGLDSLELKQRMNRITETMIQYLPDEFDKAGEILLASLGNELNDDLASGRIDDTGIAGWGIMPMAHYVGLRGQNHFDLSMTLLKEMTKRASSEFAIRLFILESPEKTVSVLKDWTTDSNQHVRRLVSEGLRPRLPWAMQLPLFIEDPLPVIEILELLKDDDQEYVRRSVANNLNDIAKDHPELVSDIASKWMHGANYKRKKLIRHACRTLIKNGHKKTLRVLGYKLPRIKGTRIEIITPTVIFGEALQFRLSIHSDASKDQPLLIDYIIHHQKANGSTSPKVFKWKTTTLQAKKQLISTKKHAIKKITTRTYYPGLHKLEIVINGVSTGVADFMLEMP